MDAGKDCWPASITGGCDRNQPSSASLAMAPRQQRKAPLRPPWDSIAARPMTTRSSKTLLQGLHGCGQRVAHGSTDRDSPERGAGGNETSADGRAAPAPEGESIERTGHH